MELKYKGNQNQFKVNAELDNVLEQIQVTNAKEVEHSRIAQLVKDGKASIHKWQKLIKIADKCKDGWQVVEDYESDDLASNSEDEKKLKKAKEAAGKKRKAKEFKSYENKRHKPGSHASDNVLFRGKRHMYVCNFILCEFLVLLCKSIHPSL